jgi:hypothetical protein
MKKHLSTPSNVINVINVISQNTASTAESLQNTEKITAREWRVVLTRGEYTRTGKSCAAITFTPGNLGYARRNGFQPDYVQVVCPATKGNIGSWHIHEAEAARLLTVARVAPDQAAVQRVWASGWAQSF